MGPKDYLTVSEHEGVVAIEEPVFTVRSFLVQGTRAALLVDTGTGIGDIAGLVRERARTPVWALLTHGHWDHIGEAAAFDLVLAHRRFVPEGPTPEEARELTARCRTLGLHVPPPPLHLAIEKPDPAWPGIRLTGGERIDLGGIRLHVLALSGHTAGDLALWEPERGWLFTGDLVYAGAIEIQGQGADFEMYRRSISTLSALDPVRTLFCGHEVPFQDGALLGEVATSLEEPQAVLREKTFRRHRFVLNPPGAHENGTEAPRDR